jgi:hypothetical protein
MKYCVRVRNDGNSRDVLVALGKVIHEDNVGETSDIQPDKERNSEENEDTDESKEVSDVFISESLYCGYGRLHLQDCSVSAAMPH